MIAYEDLVAALNSWRGRNGLATTPPDYGDPSPLAYDDVDASAPNEVYDLSDDSGLIMTEDLVQAGEIGAIETGVEAHGSYDDDGYEDGTPDVTANDVEVLSDDPAAYDDDSVDAIDVDEAGVLEEDALGETLEAEADDVLEEEAVDVADYDDPMIPIEDPMDAYAEPEPLDAPPMDDDDLGGATVVAAEPGELEEPDELPGAPGPDDEPLP